MTNIRKEKAQLLFKCLLDGWRELCERTPELRRSEVLHALGFNTGHELLGGVKRTLDLSFRYLLYSDFQSVWKFLAARLLERAQSPSLESEHRLHRPHFFLKEDDPLGKYCVCHTGSIAQIPVKILVQDKKVQETAPPPYRALRVARATFAESDASFIRAGLLGLGFLESLAPLREFSDFTRKGLVGRTDFETSDIVLDLCRDVFQSGLS